jgi:carbamoyl-phosphate synthase large subunit
MRKVYKLLEKKSPTALDLIARREVAFVVNVSNGNGQGGRRVAKAHRTDGYLIRRATVDANMPLFTDMPLAKAFVRARATYGLEDVAIRSWQEYLGIKGVKIKNTKRKR